MFLALIVIDYQSVLICFSYKFLIIIKILFDMLKTGVGHTFVLQKMEGRRKGPFWQCFLAKTYLDQTSAKTEKKAHISYSMIQK